MQPELLPLFVAVPLGAAFLGLLLKRPLPRSPEVLAWLSSAALLVLAVQAVIAAQPGATVAGGWALVEADGASFVPGVAMVLDGLAALFLLAVAIVSAAAITYAHSYLEDDGGRPHFFALVSLLVAGMNGAVLAGDVFNLYVFIEVASIASYALVAYGTRGREIEAAFKYLMLGAVASLSLLLGIGLLYAATGRLNLADLGVAIGSGAVPGPVLLVVSALFLAGLGLKAATMPFHAWLPDAHASAPAPISALLSGLLIKTLGVYALVRIFFSVVGMGSGVGPAVQTLLLVLGSLSMVGGVLLAIGQTDVKRLLAYSSISQMGFVLVAFGTNTWLGVAAGLFHAFNHSLFKSALFLVTGSIERLTGTRDLSQMGGLFRVAPLTTVGGVGASLAIGGVPPFNGFWSKLLILIALFSAGHPVVGAIAAGTAVLTLVAVLRILRHAFFGALPERLRGLREVSAWMATPVLALVLLCLLTGLLWPLGIDALVGSAADAVKSDVAVDVAPAEYRALVHGAEGRTP